jgi:hypothetical protein
MSVCIGQSGHSSNSVLSSCRQASRSPIEAGTFVHTIGRVEARSQIATTLWP